MNYSSFSSDHNKILSVSELTYSTKVLLEQAIPLSWISGEISNLKRYHSGHWYFSLKDNNAQVRCVMFSHKNRYLDWTPRDGLQVEVRARVTLYEPRGDFQLNIETIRRAGLGSLFATFEQLKSKLEKSGLFDSKHKKILPIYPKQIGVITSPSAAAFQDVLTILNKRMAAIPVIIYPTLVQGERAAENIVNAIRNAITRDECDTLIICRGGGSIEDLWPFNEERVAQAIYNCPIPIISGIGHETDFTIADFVSDVRAPTPTGAAQLACPDNQTLKQHLNIICHRIQQSNRHTVDRLMQHFDILSLRLIPPGERIRNQLTQLQYLFERLANAWSHLSKSLNWKLALENQHISRGKPDIKQLSQQNQKKDLQLRRSMNQLTNAMETNLNRLQNELNHLNPKKVLARGYCISYTSSGDIIRDNNQIDCDDTIQIVFAKGQCKAKVLKK